MWSSSQIYVIESIFVSISADAFSLLNNEWSFDNDWLAEAETMKNINISTWDKLQLVNNKRVLSVTLAGKQYYYQ